MHARCPAALDARAGEAAIHVGCGTGYYTAILGESVTSTGTVVAYELDQDLARQAATNLESWQHIAVRGRSGTDNELPPCDIIYVSAGATRPPDAWLDALHVGGQTCRVVLLLKLLDDCSVVDRLREQPGIR